MTLKLQKYQKVGLFLMLTYFVSYITRINYGAVISEMIVDLNTSKSLLSLAVTGSFITYGVGQLVSGVLGDLIQPKRLVLCGLLITTAMNLIIPTLSNPYIMAVVWCINGFAQAFMWPPIVKIMSALLTDSEYTKATVLVSWGSSLGTMIVYLLGSLFVAVSGWRSVFIFSAVCAITMIFVWNKFCPNLENTRVQKQDKGDKTKVKFISPVLIAIMIAIVLQGMLRDGVTTWMPTYVAETFDLSNSIAILTGVILPIFSIGCLSLTGKIYEKVFKNPLVCSAVIFGFGALCGLGLAAIPSANPVVSVLLTALLNAAMHGVNFILVCIIPSFFKKQGIVSTVSGVVNSCTYIGSALSTYGIAVISDKMGWSYTLNIWFAIALVGTVICIVCIKPWIKKAKQLAE